MLSKCLFALIIRTVWSFRYFKCWGNFCPGLRWKWVALLGGGARLWSDVQTSTLFAVHVRERSSFSDHCRSIESDWNLSFVFRVYFQKDLFLMKFLTLVWDFILFIFIGNILFILIPWIIWHHFNDLTGLLVRKDAVNQMPITTRWFSLYTFYICCMIIFSCNHCIKVIAKVSLSDQRKIMKT